MNISSSIKRLLLGSVVVATIVGGGIIALAAPAEAASSCYGDYCSGRDPSSTGVGGVPCANDGVTVAHADLEVYRNDYPGSSTGSWVKVGDLDLRWSNRCQVNWARASTYDSTSMVDVVVQQSTGYNQVKVTQGWWWGTGAGVYWTNMIYSPVAACRAYVDGDSFRNRSTSWR